MIQDSNMPFCRPAGDQGNIWILSWPPSHPDATTVSIGTQTKPQLVAPKHSAQKAAPRADRNNIYIYTTSSPGQDPGH